MHAARCDGDLSKQSIRSDHSHTTSNISNIEHTTAAEPSGLTIRHINSSTPQQQHSTQPSIRLLRVDADVQVTASRRQSSTSQCEHTGEAEVRARGGVGALVLSPRCSVFNC